MNIFMKTVSISNGLISRVVYIGNTKNGYHLSGSQNLFCRRKLTLHENFNVYKILTFINFSWRLWAQIKLVYLIKFTQAVWFLTKVWMKRIWLNTAEVPMLMRQMFFIWGIRRTFWKKRELIKNDVLLWQFMLCKNINQYNNGQCKSSSDYKGAGIWIGKLMRGSINTSAH